jgi:GNAT superfamily N-acetyltransferase
MTFVRRGADPQHSRPVIREADLGSERDCRALVKLLTIYRAHPMGGRLPPLTKKMELSLTSGLRNHPSAFILFAQRRKAIVAAAVCFSGFSTFCAKPLINVHDLIVAPAWRKRGIGKSIMEAIIRKAVLLDCCKVTLEVRTDNEVAKYLYRSLGFGPCAAPMEFWSRPIGGDMDHDIAPDDCMSSNLNFTIASI